ncbi:MAG: hypothetical protein EAZ89_10525 [Bacteroidetes bacterium]|nr:MAG: hypothetical protein EAZ89_10525 [Bacteroidota bacterium]
MNGLRRIGTLAAAICLPLLFFAQIGMPFSGKQSWKMVSSEHFDVYYSGDEAASAGQVARYAEVARHEAAALFDSKPEGRYALLYSSDPNRLLFSNIDMKTPDRTAGIISLPPASGYIVNPGSSDQLYHEVKREITRLVLDEFSNGNRVGSALQSQLMLYPARWFQEGLAEYVAQGWTYEDEMWINTLSHADLLAMAMEGEGKTNRIVRKSVWHYITHEYSDQKISEIIYLVNVTHSIESGIISVLGITLNTLTERWHEFILGRNNTYSAGREMAENLAGSEHLLIRPGQELVSFSLHEASGKVALWLNEEGKQTLWLSSPDSRDLKPLRISSGLARPDAGNLSWQQPVAWNPQGTLLLTTAWVKGTPYLIWLDTETGEAEYQKLPSQIEAVYSFAWSPDGTQVVAGALSDGHQDIFLLKKGSSDFAPLLQDPADDLDPVWSSDNSRIYFASNRGGKTEIKAPWEALNRNFDLYSLSIESGKIQALTETPGISERNPQVAGSSELYYLSDESGVYNISWLNVQTRESGFFSNLTPGIQAFRGGEKTLAISTPISGSLYLYVLPAASAHARRKPEPTFLRLERLAGPQNFAEQAPPPVIPVEKTPDVPEVKSEDPQPAEPKAAEPVRYYIFDEDTQPYEQRKEDAAPATGVRQPQRQVSASNIYRPAQIPLPGSVEVSDARKASSPWSARYIGLSLGYDPVAKTGPLLEMGFQDLLNRHRLDVRVNPSFNFRNSRSQIRYTYLAPRIDFFAEASQLSRRIRESNIVQTDSSLLFRFDQVSLQAGGRYPLSAFAAAEVSGGFIYVDRKDQRLRRSDLSNASDQLLRAGVKLTYSKLKQYEGFRYAGLAAEASFESFYSIQQSAFAFHRARGEVRYYRRVLGEIVLATRAMAGLTFPKTIQPFYMGGVDVPIHRPVIFQGESEGVRAAVTDTSLYSVQFLDFLMPMRGFLPFTRMGSKYVMANFELRIPLSRMSRHALPAHGLYNLEFIPFVDAGTVWIDGNPFSQKKPTDTQFISNGPITVKLQTLKSPFLIGFGSGVRTNLLGWSLRMDLAWGIDDFTIRRPMFTSSLAHNF